MPSIDLTQGPKTLLRYNVVGQQVEGETRFVKHVGLFNEDNQSVKMGDEVKVLHMRPPLEQGGTIKVHVAGQVPLMKGEIDEIKAWSCEIKDEYEKNKVCKKDQYIIHPHWKDECDPNTGVRRYRRYSCVGFVFDSHLQVDIELLQIDEGSLPDVYPHTIKSAYGLKPGSLLAKFGLEGNGPWKVMLAGYVLHALNRPTYQIRQEPYRAGEGDGQF